VLEAETFDRVQSGEKIPYASFQINKGDYVLGGGGNLNEERLCWKISMLLVLRCRRRERRTHPAAKRFGGNHLNIQRKVCRNVAQG